MQSACIVDEAMFECLNEAELLTILDLDLDDDITSWSVDIDRQTLSVLVSRFSLQMNPRVEGIITVRPAHWLHDLPYKVHTGRELDLMLAGLKPFSAFVVPTSAQSEDIYFTESIFDLYVEQRIFVKNEFIDTPPSAGGDCFESRVVMYALPGEEWRFKAFELLQEIGKKVAWCDGLERLEGALLGYKEWEADAYFEALDSQPGRRIWKR